MDQPTKPEVCAYEVLIWCVLLTTTKACNRFVHKVHFFLHSFKLRRYNTSSVRRDARAGCRSGCRPGFAKSLLVNHCELLLMLRLLLIDRNRRVPSPNAPPVRLSQHSQYPGFWSRPDFIPPWVSRSTRSALGAAEAEAESALPAAGFITTA